MAAIAPNVRGKFAGHPLAKTFADEVVRIHRRYAVEVVFANGLCPFLKDVDTGFGEFCIMLDPPRDDGGTSTTEEAPELDLDAAVAAVLSSPSSVVHLVYPCLRPRSQVFDKFAGRLGAALKRATKTPPVMAVFHPELTGDKGDAHRLVGLLRRAPDPFVQLIPEGLHKGGTVFAAIGEIPTVSSVNPALANFARLRGAPLEQLFALQDDIHADRARSYAPYLEAFGCAPTPMLAPPPPPRAP